MFRSTFRLAIVASVAVVLASCTEERARIPARALAPVPAKTVALMTEKNVDRNAPVLVRAYKKESEIEVWKQDRTGEYVLVKTYPVCRWSGQLGPKTREGDRQVPEGFYTISAAQMNPNSSYWLSFNVGYPNTMERAMGRSGGDIMVHGTCSSRGCFAMTNEQMEEIYAVMRDAFQGGQKTVQFQSFPFRMNAENMAKFRHDPNMPFWKNLKEGSDHFEVTKREPAVAYCGRSYVFNAATAEGRFEPTGACPRYTIEPSVAAAVDAKRRADETQAMALIERGLPAVRVQHADGNQHASFRGSEFAIQSNAGEERIAPVPAQRRADLGDVSRPEAIGAVTEVHLDANGRPKVEPVVVAAATPAPVASAPQPVRTAAVDASKDVSKDAGKDAAKDATKPASSGLFSGIPTMGALFGGPSTPAPAATASTPDAAPFYKRLIRFGEPEPLPQPVNAPLPPRRQASLSAPLVR